MSLVSFGTSALRTSGGAGWGAACVLWDLSTPDYSAAETAEDGVSLESLGTSTPRIFRRRRLPNQLTGVSLESFRDLGTPETSGTDERRNMI